MASIEKRSTSKGPRFDVRYRLGDGRQRTKTFTSRRDANRFAARAETDRLRGVLVDPALGKTTFEVWARQWLAGSEQANRATTVARDQSAIEHHLIPALGARRVAALTPNDIRAVVNGWTAAGLAPRSVRTYYGVLRAILNSAVAADLIARSPCRDIRMPPADRKRDIRFLTPDELDRLADAMPAEYRPMAYLAGVLGLRFSEVTGLRVGRVDLLRGTLEVAETIAEVRGHVLRADVKSKAGRRTLPLPSFLTEELSAHFRARGLTGADPDALVFVSGDGGPVRAANFRHRIWSQATRDADLEGFTFHHLRHTAVGFLIDAGAHLAVMQRRIGHSSIRTTLDVYGHVLSDTDQEVTDHLEGLFGPGDRPQPGSHDTADDGASVTDITDWTDRTGT